MSNELAALGGALALAVAGWLVAFLRGRRHGPTSIQAPPVDATMDTLDNAAGVIAERNEEASREVVEALEGPSPGDAIADIINRRFH